MCGSCSHNIVPEVKKLINENNHDDVSVVNHSDTDLVVLPVERAAQIACISLIMTPLCWKSNLRSKKTAVPDHFDPLQIVLLASGPKILSRVISTTGPNGILCSTFSEFDLFLFCTS